MKTIIVAMLVMAGMPSEARAADPGKDPGNDSLLRTGKPLQLAGNPGLFIPIAKKAADAFEKLPLPRITAPSILEKRSPEIAESLTGEKLRLTLNQGVPSGFRWEDDIFQWRSHWMRIDVPAMERIRPLGSEDGIIESFTLSTDWKLSRRTVLSPFFRQAVPVDDMLMPRGRYNYESRLGLMVRFKF